MYTKNKGGYGGARPTFGSRPSFGSRPTSRFAPRRPVKRGQASFNDVSRFINKVIVTEEAEVFVPEHAFGDFAVHDALKKVIALKGYTTPTPIQDKSIPHILAGQDIVGIANTGTGKTAAFLIPLIHKVMTGIMAKQNEQVLIVAPTRELAIQIDAEFKKFTDGLNLYSVCVVGGAPINKQIRDLRYQNDFIIGTPGRIKDLMEQGYINLSKFNTIVLDEADRMLDMGFVEDMRFMMAKMPKVRHTLFFSATLSKEIEQLIGEFLNNPMRVSVKTRDTSKNIDQDVVRTRGLDKLDVLHDILNQPECDKVIIFGRTKHGVERLTEMLAKRGFKADAIHGDKNHTGRQRALTKFKESQVQILVATDVAARGLDIPNVSHVINYDLPSTYEDYVHRIGRTGRAGKPGKALTFID
ncbi:MAG: DEAD/DEAH box helicase [Candidatus Zambryskibacteria bacterium]|nr:DEAD/DEAH box helicase [Candidatus Zambryskibacteria bacterium]